MVRPSPVITGCPTCGREWINEVDRCPYCEELLGPPVPLPFLRRPGATWALAAIALAILSTITYGLLGLVALLAILGVIRDISRRENRGLCKGVKEVAVVAFFLALICTWIGLWLWTGKAAQALPPLPPAFVATHSAAARPNVR